MPAQDTFIGLQPPGTFGSVRGPTFLDLAAPPEPERNIVSQMVRDLGRDAYGAARTAAAVGGELWALMTGSAPLQWSDLETRDIQGAMMIGALTTGGFAAAGARSLLGAGASAVGRAAITASAEAASGAAFGLMRPLDEDEDRMRAVMGDAAFGGTLGLGASFAKSAVMGVLGGKIAAVKAAASRISIAKAAGLERDKLVAREIAGLQFMNPTSGERMVIMRGVDGKVRGVTYSGNRLKQGVTPETFGDDFGAGVAQAIRSGFTSEMAPWRPERALKGMNEMLDPRVMQLIDAADGNIIQALDQIDIGNYKAVRDAASYSAQVTTALHELGAEVLLPATPLGDVMLSTKARESLLASLKMSPKTPDAVLAREGVRRGIVSLDGLADGVNADDAMYELVVNGLVPEGSTVVTNQLRDLVGGMLLTGKRIARLHPEVQPLIDLGGMVLHQANSKKELSSQWLHELRAKVPAAAAARGVQLIDEAGEAISAALPDDIDAAMLAEARNVARAQSLAAAQAEGPDVAFFVAQVNERMEAYLAEMHAAGIVDETVGLPGYFPIVNTDKWRLDIINNADVKFQGYHASREAALAEAKRVRTQLGQPLNATISRWHVSLDRTNVAHLEPQQLGKLTKAIRANSKQYVEDVFNETGMLLDPDELAKRQLSEGIGIAAKAHKKGTQFAKPRLLGIRDFAQDPFDALTTYTHSLDRTLALRNFEPMANQVIATLGVEQKAMTRWATDYIDRIMGRPSTAELAFDNALESMRQLGLNIDVAPRALSRWLSVVRKGETMLRLSNPFSAAINLTQLLTNTVAVLGAADTARGMGVYGGKGFTANLNKLKSLGLDLGMFAPLSDDTTMAAFNTPRAAFREKRYAEAAYRMSLYAFNGAEKMNRAVTAWGAYQKSLRTGASEKLAAEYAQEVVNRAQFDYGAHNMPALLAGPVGGLLFQFKSFILNEIDFVASLSPKEAARFVTSMSVLGGLSQILNLPGADIADMASGIFSDEKLSERLAREGGDQDADALKRAFLFGVPGMLHADVTDYVGVGSLSEITRGLFGPAVNDSKTLYTFLKDATNELSVNGFVSNETKNVFVQRSAPALIRRAIQGYDIAATGDVRSPYTGKLIYRPEKRLQAAVLTAFGPPTLELQAERAADVVQMRRRENYIQARNTFTKDAAMAALERRGDDVATILRDAHAAGHIITSDDLRYWIKEMRTPADSRRQRRTPRTLRDAAELFQTTGLSSWPPELGG